MVVLDEVVLLVAQRYRQDVLATEEDDNYNCGKRHTAYRQFILWTFGYLGAGNTFFQAVVYGELGINTHIVLASTAALFREDLVDHSNDM